MPLPPEGEKTLQSPGNCREFALGYARLKRDLNIRKRMADRSERMAGRAETTPSKGPMQPMTPAAFATQFQGSWRALWCIAAAVVGDRAQADDVLQEAAVVALGKLGQFDPASNFSAWMG